MLNRKWMNFVKHISKIFEMKFNDRPLNDCSKKQWQQVRSCSHRNYLFITEFFFLEKSRREANSAKTEDKTDEDGDPSNKEDIETTTDPNDLLPTEKGPDADEENPRKSATPPLADDASPPPPATTEVPVDDLHGLGPEDANIQAEPIGEITADHPEVQKSVEQAVEEARTAAVNIPADVYAELIQNAIQAVEQEQREKDPQGPL